MRILGLDVGTRTIGVAISDELGWTAQGLETLRRVPNQIGQDLDNIKKFIEQYSVEKIVVGLPKNMNGTVGPSGEMCKEFAETLKEHFNLPVILWDERLTTVAAEKMLISADVSRKKRKQVIDKMAAVLILKGFLDSQT